MLLFYKPFLIFNIATSLSPTCILPASPSADSIGNLTGMWIRKPHMHPYVIILQTHSIFQYCNLVIPHMHFTFLPIYRTTAVTVILIGAFPYAASMEVTCVIWNAKRRH